MSFNPIPLILLLTGAYMLVRLRFFYIRHPIKCIKVALGALRERENLTAFTLALAGTLGVGNVLGVAVGLMVGGPGSLFWIFFSAIPAGAIKYAEVLVASDFGKRGMVGAVRESLGRSGRPLSALYCLCCLTLAFVMGGALQCRSVVDATAEIVGFDGLWTGAVLTLLVAAAVLGFGRRMGKITLYIIPMTTILYIIVMILTVFAKIERLPDVIKEVVSDAFSPEAGIGGALAIINSRAMREGFARGILSNEAGAGTSSLGHITGADLQPGVRALFGVLEVFFDTSVLCTLTGIAILVSTPDLRTAASGMELVMSSVGSAIGAAPAMVVALSVWAFAYSTIVCWYYYGSECISHLIGCGEGAYRVIYLAFTFLGSLIRESALIGVADVMLLVMTLITLPTLIKNSDRIVHLSESVGFIKIK